MDIREMRTQLGDTASIRSMPENMKEEAMAVLKEWIGAE